MLPLKLSCNNHLAVMFVLWAKRFNANQIHCEMHAVYGDKCFTMHHYMFGVRKC